MCPKSLYAHWTIFCGHLRENTFEKKESLYGDQTNTCGPLEVEARQVPLYTLDTLTYVVFGVWVRVRVNYPYRTRKHEQTAVYPRETASLPGNAMTSNYQIYIYKNRKNMEKPGALPVPLDRGTSFRRCGECLALILK